MKQKSLVTFPRVILLLACVGLLLFANSLNNPFILDDLSKIVGNPDIRSLSQIWSKLFYPYGEVQLLYRNDPSRPVVFLSYAINYAISELKPWSYHLFDIVVHVLNSCLIYLLVANAFARKQLANSEWIGLFAALIFLVHPLNAGTVIYAYGRSDTLGSLFALTALTLSSQPKINTQRIFLTIIAFLLSLGCKQSFVILPILIFSSRLLILNEQFKNNRKLYLSLLSATAFYLLARYFYFGAIGDLESFGQTIPTWDYLALQPVAILKYLTAFFWPKWLSIDHFVLPENTDLSERLEALAILLAFAVGVAFILRSASENLKRLFQMGTLFYLVSLLPTSSILPTVDAVVERRTYFANIGLVICFFTLLSYFFTTNSLSKLMRVLITIIFVLSVVTWHRNQTFQSAEEVWKETIRSYPASPRALNNISTIYIEQKNYDQAHHILSFLVSTYDRDPLSRTNLATVLSLEDSPKQDFAKAEWHFRRAIELKPDLYDAYYGLGRLYQIQNRINDAESAYRQALNINPRHVLSLNNLALLLAKQNRQAEGQVLLEKALAIDPNSEMIKTNLAMLTGRNSKRDELPLDQVPSDIIISAYLKALASDKNNQEVRAKFAEFCFTRRLPCAFEQYTVLSKQDPTNQEYLRRLRDSQAFKGKDD